MDFYPGAPITCCIGWEVFQLQGTTGAALPQFLTSLGIGLLLGIERERKQDPRAGGCARLR